MTRSAPDYESFDTLELPMLRAVRPARALTFIFVASAGVFAFLVWLIYIKPASGVNSQLVAALPAVNASLNGISTILLLLGLVAVKQRYYIRHTRFMLGAMVSSGLFLVSYIIYHSHHGDTKFTGVGLIRPAYFFILISHIVLSAVAVPLILTSLYLSLAGKIAAHRRVSKFTFPIWLYVSFTGVIIFVVLKVFSR